MEKQENNCRIGNKMRVVVNNGNHYPPLFVLKTRAFIQYYSKKYFWQTILLFLVALCYILYLAKIGR